MPDLSGQTIKGYELGERLGGGAYVQCTAPPNPRWGVKSQ